MIWRRRDSSGAEPGAPSADGPRDSALPMLSVPQAESLSALYRQALAERGIETTPSTDGVLVAPGYAFGLHNLAVELSHQPWSRWRTVIDEQADAVAAATAEEPPPATADQLRPWLVARSADIAPHYPAREALPGISVGIAVAYGEDQAIDPDVASVRHLGDADALLERAIANLRAQSPPERHDVPARPGEPDSVVHALLSNDRYGGARVLLLDELAAQLLGSERPAYGRFVAVPNQHSLLLHEPSGPGVRAAISLMVQIAQARFRDGSGPISPHVYFLPAQGPAEQTTEQRETGEMVVRVTPAVQAVFDRFERSPSG